MESIVFFGSGPVAAAALAFLAKNFNIEAVVTKPRPAHHRGDFPVVSLAEVLGLRTLFATNKQELDDLFAGNPVKSRIAVLVDFGIIVSQNVINYFPLGIINSHFSLLPQWRGADPITFSILSGQKETGVSLMLLTAGLDEGPLLATTEPVAITPQMTTPELTGLLVELSNQTLAEIVPLYLNGTAVPRPQDTTKPATYSRRLTKEDGIIDWQKPAEQLEREIRAFTGWPKSRTTLGGKELIITQAEVVKEQGAVGQIVTKEKKLLVYCGSDALRILKLKPAGKPEMTAEAFLAGNSL